MTAGLGAEAAKVNIVEELRRAREAGGRRFVLQFAAVWIGLIGLIVYVLWVTGNIDLAFFGRWGPFILGGAWTTVLISVLSIILAVVLALLGALGRLSRNPAVNAIASLYVSLVRGTPLLIQILFVYLALPRLGVILDPLHAGIYALGFNYGAYMTETFRAGIQAVPRGQREAAQALGMTEGLLMRRIVLPQAFRVVIPPIGNEFIAMMKDSALVSVISVQELLWRAGAAGRPTLKIIEALLLAALIYWVLTMIFSFFQDWLERRMARGERR